MIAGLALLHLYLLHQVGSSNPLGIDAGDMDVVRFYPYYYLKDTFAFVTVFGLFMAVVCLKPNMFGHPDNYIQANPSVTPAHIVPEWYFLPFYSMLKSVPNKLGGAVVMGASLVILYALPFLDFSRISFVGARTFHLFFFNLFVLDVILLG